MEKWTEQTKNAHKIRKTRKKNERIKKRYTECVKKKQTTDWIRKRRVKQTNKEKERECTKKLSVVKGRDVKELKKQMRNKRNAQCIRHKKNLQTVLGRNGFKRKTKERNVGVP